MELKIRESVIKKKRFDFPPLVLGIKNALINLKKIILVQTWLV